MEMIRINKYLWLSINLLLMVVMYGGCGTDPKATEIYKGHPYGDFLLVQEQVQDCLGKPHEYRNIQLYNEDFYCDVDPQGVILVNGCSPDEWHSDFYIRMNALDVNATRGQLYAEELVHTYGISDHTHFCMRIFLAEGFDFRRDL